MVVLAAHESCFFLQIFFDKDVSKHRETGFAVVIAVKSTVKATIRTKLEVLPESFFLRHDCQVRRRVGATIFVVKLFRAWKGQYLDVLHMFRWRHVALPKKKIYESLDF